MEKRTQQTASGAIFENELAGAIADEIENRGAITFERFMERALYDAEFGYYANGGARTGKKGDFYTSPTAHRAFGETLARLIGGLKKQIELPNGTRKMTVLEAGGGDGGLALDILSSLARTDPETYGSVEYILLDRCKPRQCAVSGKHSNFRRAESFTDIKKPVTGIILSNELFDAIPFHRLVFRNGKIKEIFVSVSRAGSHSRPEPPPLTMGEGRGEGTRSVFMETESAPSTDETVRYFDGRGGADKMGFAEGQRFEVCRSAGNLLKRMADTLEKGVILTIDYGFGTEELFSPARMSGTFKCVSNHRISESLYEKIGEQDITAHVDFGNLEKTGEESGLATLKYTTQGQFLIDWGIMDIAGENPDEILAVKNLFMPGMMGDSFRVLLQTKNARELKSGFYPESPFRISFGID